MKAAILALAALLALPIASTAALPDPCADPCSIPNGDVSFWIAPVRSGSRVIFDGDGGHAMADGSGVAGSASSCFTVENGVPVRLDIDAGALFATVSDEAVECTTAQALPDGSFALPYHCRLHPTMRGAIVVSP